MTTAPMVQRWSLEFYNDGRRIMQKMKEKDDGYYVEHPDYAALAARCERLEKALPILRALQSESLGDFIYSVRESEGKGWDGPRVKAWSDACRDMDDLLEQFPAALSALAPEPQQDEQQPTGQGDGEG